MCHRLIECNCTRVIHRTRVRTIVINMNYEVFQSSNMLLLQTFYMHPSSNISYHTQSSNLPLSECYITIHSESYEKTSMCDCANNRRKIEKSDENKWQWKKKNLNIKNHQTCDSEKYIQGKKKKDNNHTDEEELKKIKKNSDE